jgi:hypothetical protein
MVARESKANRAASAEVSKVHPEKLVKEIAHLSTLDLPRRHLVRLKDVSTRYLGRILLKTYESQPQGFEQLLYIQGVGPATVRALSLVAELMYGPEPSFRDPARFSFAHGGKDGTPYPVNKTNYDQTIHMLREAVSRAKVGERDRLDALRRLATFGKEIPSHG